MQNTIKSLVISTVTLVALSLTAVAQPPNQDKAQAPSEQSVTTVVESRQGQEAPAQPLVTQEDRLLRTAETPDRPRGESRTMRDQKSRAVEKPLLEVHGF
jgi:TolA-binding protein